MRSPQKIVIRGLGLSLNIHREYGSGSIAQDVRLSYNQVTKLLYVGPRGLAMIPQDIPPYGHIYQSGYRSITIASMANTFWLLHSASLIFHV